MSQALAKIQSTKIEVVDVATVAQQDSCLQLACEGQLVVSDLDPAYFADDETASDLRGVATQVPRLSANGQAGCFCEPGTDKAELRKCPDVIEGVILARREGAIHYVPQDAKADTAGQLGYSALLGAEKWICRNSNVAEPGKAILNPQLTQQQRQEAHALGIGGDTGKGCMGCSAGCWRQLDGHNLRMCSRSEALVWMDSKDPEPRVLQVGAGNSVATLKKWFASRFKRQNRPLNLFTYLVRFSWGSEKIDGKDVFVLSPSIIGALPAPMMDVLRQVRASCMWMLERASAAQAAEEPTPDPVDLPEPAKGAEDVVGDMF